MTAAASMDFIVTGCMYAFNLNCINEASSFYSFFMHLFVLCFHKQSAVGTQCQFFVRPDLPGSDGFTTDGFRWEIHSVVCKQTITRCKGLGANLS